MQPVPVERFLNRITDRISSIRSFWINFLQRIRRCNCCRSNRTIPRDSDVESPQDKKPLLNKIEHFKMKASPIVGLQDSSYFVPPDSPDMLAKVAEAYKEKIGENSSRIESIDEQAECVICLEVFNKENPEMHTLCSCGANKTAFHYACLLQWTEKHEYCPACRGKLYYEEMLEMANDANNTPN
mmetsp:Transcript_6002/g.7932  ORF Transcript_6002/g.7932 Transcript_6002/m.7932 type:complete len:184 (+) Transcript_6002:45-596(+)